MHVETKRQSPRVQQEDVVTRLHPRNGALSRPPELREKTETSAPTLPWGRLAFLGTLLATEVLALTCRFDTKTLDNAQGWWIDLVRLAPQLPGLGLTIALAALLAGGARWHSALLKVGLQSSTQDHGWRLLLGHFAALGSFVALTALVFEGHVQAESLAAAGVAAWLSMGLLTLALWVALIVPPGAWRTLAWENKRILAAAVVVGGAAWMAGKFTIQQWRPFSSLTLWTVQQLLSVLYSDVVCQAGEGIIGTTAFRVRIAASCSGYEGIGLIWVFLAAYLWLYREELRFPQAFLLFPIGTLAIWLANAVRIATLVAIGTWGAPAVAFGGFHSQAGWIAFAMVALGLVVVTQNTPLFSTRPRQGQTVNPVLPYLAPLLTLVAVTMMTGAFASGPFDRLYLCRVLAVGGVFWWFRGELRNLCWSWSWTAVRLGLVTFAMWMLLEKMGPQPSEPPSLGQELGLSTGWTTFWLVGRLVGSVVMVPVAEELAFRGYLLRRLVAADFEKVKPGTFTWLSFGVSSLLFGALHSRWLSGTLAGMLFSCALYRRGRVGDAVLAHAVTNALIGFYVLATGSWSLWS